jgi:hypothetical protein
MRIDEVTSCEVVRDVCEDVCEIQRRGDTPQKFFGEPIVTI